MGKQDQGQATSVSSAQGAVCAGLCMEGPVALLLQMDVREVSSGLVKAV